MTAEKIPCPPNGGNQVFRIHWPDGRTETVYSRAEHDAILKAAGYRLGDEVPAAPVPHGACPKQQQAQAQARQSTPADGYSTPPTKTATASLYQPAAAQQSTPGITGHMILLMVLVSALAVVRGLRKRREATR